MRAHPGLALAAAAARASPPARADAVEDFYRDRNVSIVVATTAGGPYDMLARLFAKHMGAHIPGAPAITVKNMPGSGGLVAANWLYNVAEKDGSVIGALLNLNPFEPAFETAGARYDPVKLNWLGASDKETAFLTLWHDAPVNSIADLQTREVTVGASAPSTAPTFFARLETELLHVKLKIITGYPGLSEAFVAMEQGELNGYPSVSVSSLLAARPAWLREKMIKLALRLGTSTPPEFADVPALIDLVKTPDDRLLAEAAFAITDIGRPYALPPGAPADRVAALSTAMRDTFADPAFVADMRRAGLQIDAPQSAADVRAIIDRVYKAPPRILDRLKKLKQ